VLWLAVQGSVHITAIFSLIILLIIAIVKNLVKAKGDDAMGGNVNNLMKVFFELFYDMSISIAGNALLTKALQSYNINI